MKNKFWFRAGAAAVSILSAIIMLWGGAGYAISAAPSLLEKVIVIACASVFLIPTFVLSALLCLRAAPYSDSSANIASLLTIVAFLGVWLVASYATHAGSANKWSGMLLVFAAGIQVFLLFVLAYIHLRSTKAE